MNKKLQIMDCKEVHNKMVFFLEGSLSDYDKQLTNSHIMQCNDCKLYASRIENMLEIINKQKRIEPKPFLHTRVMAKIENKEVNRAIFYRRVLQPIILSAIVLFAIFGGFTIGKSYISNSTSTQVNETYYWNDFSQEPIERAILTDNQ